MAKIVNRRISKAVGDSIGSLSLKAAYYMNQHAIRLIKRGGDYTPIHGESGIYNGVIFDNG